MTPTYQSRLEFAATRLRWCLEQPLHCGGRDWGMHVLLALEQLSEAFERRIGFLEGPGGPLAEIADPGLLPFTSEAKRVSDLRSRCQRLRDHIQAVTIQFRDALQLFPYDAAGPADAIADARAFRLFGVLGSCATDLLAALEEYRTAEASLLHGAQHAGVSAE